VDIIIEMLKHLKLLNILIWFIIGVFFIQIILNILIWIGKAPQIVMENQVTLFTILIISVEFISVFFMLLASKLKIEEAIEKLKSKLVKPSELKKIKKTLDKYNRLEEALKSNYIKNKEFDIALKFFSLTKEERVEIFVRKINATNMVKEGEFWRIHFDSNFGLYNINNFLLYISDKKAKQIERDLQNIDEKIFVIAQEKEQDILIELASDKRNRVIAPKIEELTFLLLLDDYIQSRVVLIWVFSNCLLSKDISPYQTNGDIKNGSNFFGRKEILRNILGSNQNHLIVGSRQLGKSSILQALKRYYDINPNVDCYLFTMNDTNILLEMQTILDLEEERSLEEIVTYISKQDKKSIFLIDEADEFIEADAKNGYRITKAFRKLAQDGKATFVITGFWTLYYYVTSDYHAPIKNFGELIKLGGLENEACRALMIEPMKLIGVSYENSQLIDDLIVRCGNRANLIAITCHEVLKVIENNIITQKNIEHVIRHSTLEDYLKGWKQISLNEDENTLDRAILFLTLRKEYFRLGDVVKMLEEVGLDTLDENKIDESLGRLVIGYFLGKDRGNYSYRVPLFKEKLLYEDINILLNREIRRLKKI